MPLGRWGGLVDVAIVTVVQVELGRKEMKPVDSLELMGQHSAVRREETDRWFAGESDEISGVIELIVQRRRGRS